jgi:hypothetical protein
MSASFHSDPSDLERQEETRTLFQSLREAIRDSADRARRKSAALLGPEPSREAAVSLPSAAEIVSSLEKQVEAILRSSGLAA